MKKIFLLFLFIFLIQIAGFLLLQKSTEKYYMDEMWHYDQVDRMARGDYHIDINLMTFPGYHLMMSNFINIFQTVSIHFLRFVSLSFNLVGILVFFACARILDKKSAEIKTLQFSFLPIFFPFMSLLYTDGFATLLVLLSFYFFLRRNYGLSGLFAVISVPIRQINLVWLVFINILILLREIARMKERKGIRELAINYLKNSVVFITGTLILGYFFIFFSKGVVVSDYARDYVKLKPANFVNEYFFLFLVTVMFMPLIIRNLKGIYRNIKEFKWVILIIVLIYPVFLFTFLNDHPFNQAWWFLHNYPLVFFSQNWVYKSLFYLIAVLGGLYLWTIHLEKKIYYLLYPVIFVYLFPFWLVEGRYDILPFTFMILLGKTRAGWSQYLTVLYFIVASLFINYGISQNWFFP